MGVNTRTSKDRIATIDATLEVQDIGQLNQVLKQIRKVIKKNGKNTTDSSHTSTGQSRNGL